MEQGDDDTYPAVSHRMAQDDGPAGDNGGDQPGDQFQQENETSSAVKTINGRTNNIILMC